MQLLIDVSVAGRMRDELQADSPTQRMQQRVSAMVENNQGGGIEGEVLCVDIFGVHTLILHIVCIKRCIMHESQHR